MHLEEQALKSWYFLELPACRSPEDKSSFEKGLDTGKWLGRNIQYLLTVEAFGEESTSNLIFEDLALVRLLFSVAGPVPQSENPVHMSYKEACYMT